MKRTYVGFVLLLAVLLTIATGCGSTAATPAPTQVAQAPEAGFTPAGDVCVVPDVVGLSETAAQSMITGVGLQPVRSVQHDASVAEGAVISQSPDGGTQMEPCSGDVTLVISLGPLPEPTATPAPTNTPAPTPTPEPPGPRLGDVWTRPTDGMTMLYVPGGTFSMGKSDTDSGRSVTLDSFWIDKTEVTNAHYRRCVEAGACKALTTCDWGDPTYGDVAKDDHPVICVTWFEADTYCRWAGTQLPTDAQWEYAWRGEQGYTYPWGNQPPTCALANYHECICIDRGPYGCIGDTAAVGSYPAGASWVGALDLAGNVLEWANDWYERTPSGTQVNPTGPEEGNTKVQRGSSYTTYDYGIHINRTHNLPDYSKHDWGFRCAGSGPAE